MKVILLIICLLLASALLFIPSPILARQLAAKPHVDAGKGYVIDPTHPNKPPVSCGRGIPYKNCIPSESPPKPKPVPCNPHYERNCSPA
ncbi:hypothetical protein FH972_007966 [Carpinus fangiana]|uniref:Uncharacterized protein n=1 Tax=Carpinus fangiana TaxID=176857 RepID=A0A5N6QXA6_9ROSI|nr:hypothetical protein FH972_007966 [Carpinus fangiana]